MAKDQKPAEDQNPENSLLVDAAKAIGKTVGKVATLVGAAHTDAAAPKAKSHRPGKLVKKNKQKLPRRQKKAQQRALGNQQS
jgi:hypothetical protein